MANEHDLFDDVFGQDAEKEAALKRLAEKQAQKPKASVVAAESQADAGDSESTSNSNSKTGSDSKGNSKPESDSGSAAKTGSDSKPGSDSGNKTGSASPVLTAKKTRAKIDSTVDSGSLYTKNKPKKKAKRKSVPLEPLIEKTEHQKAIKKVLLEKANQAIEENPKSETGKTEPKSEKEENESEPENENNDESESNSDFSPSDENSIYGDNDVNRYLEDEVVELSDEDVLHEAGTIEIGTKGKAVSQAGTQAKKVSNQTEIPTGGANLELSLLQDIDKNIVFIGRKKSIFKQYGDQGSLYLGKIEEKESKFSDFKVHLDSLNPHVIFLCGARGSGKSYGIGVIAEELALKNPDVGSIVVDPVGVFWSMRLPNSDSREVSSLEEYGLSPSGLKNLKVFIPAGISSEVPKSTYDATFSMRPSLLTVEDWCLTFGIERFSPTGLLLEKTLSKVKSGYSNIEGKTIAERKEKYSLDDVINCLETDNEINSREKGYKQDSIRALVSRFEAAKAWGIFDEKGTPLSELSVEGQLTVLDTSFLEDTVTALVIGILARRILAARKIATRKEAAKRLDTQNMDDLMELEIPPTWLFIDEAHTLIPSGNIRTPATSALVEYVKQGRRPGCSLVFATQQPSAIDSRVLSQLDILIAHKLIFDDDIKAVYKRSPTVIPFKYKNPNFLKTLPVGIGLTADRREETSRAFVLRVRPRMSQHEGRDAETSQVTESMEAAMVEKLAADLAFSKIKKEGELTIVEITNLVKTLNRKHNSWANLQNVLSLLMAKNIIVEELAAFLPGAKRIREPEEAASDKSEIIEPLSENDEIGEQLELENAKSPTEKEGLVSLAEMRKTKHKITPLDVQTESELAAIASGTELLAFPTRISEARARQIADAKRQKKTLGLFGNEELIKKINLQFEPIYRVHCHVQVKDNAFVKRDVFISAFSGELVHFVNNRFIESKMAPKITELTFPETRVFQRLLRQHRTPLQLSKDLGEPVDQIQNVLDKLVSEKIVRKIENKNNSNSISAVYSVSKLVDLPPSINHSLVGSLNKVPFENADALGVAQPNFSKKQAMEMVEKLFANSRAKLIDEIYRPLYTVVLEKGTQTRTLRIDGYNGLIL
ncbi:MAG: DUF87 domain-containing protein [Candidatus Micrarchaeota archaeon]